MTKTVQQYYRILKSHDYIIKQLVQSTTEGYKANGLAKHHPDFLNIRYIPIHVKVVVNQNL